MMLTNENIISIVSSKLNSKIKNIEGPFSGLDNHVFILNHEFIFRICRNIDSIGFMNIELANLPWLKKKCPLSVPNVQFSGVFNDLPWMIYKIISGNTIENSKIPDYERFQCVEQLAIFLKKLHSFPLLQFIEKTPNRNLREAFDMNYRLQKATKIILDINLEPYSKLIKSLDIMDYLFRAKDLRTDNTKCITHGDLKSAHLIFNGKDLSGVIDWGDMQLSHPAADLGIVYSAIRH